MCQWLVNLFKQKKGSPPLRAGDGLATVIARITAEHDGAFRLHSETAILVEDAFTTAHSHDDEVGLTLDMLLLQGRNAHLSVWQLCQLAFVEDAATIARRLLELEITAAYVLRNKAREAHETAGRYLAFMWRGFPANLRALLPPNISDFWLDIERRYDALIPAGAKRWAKPWRDMFVETDNEHRYTGDYAFLSAIAHGLPDEQILNFARERIRLTPPHHVSTLLLAASSFYLRLARLWNDVHHLIDLERLGDLENRLQAAMDAMLGEPPHA